MKVLFFAVMVCLFALPSFAQPVTVVSFNVENLFDTFDDPENPHDDTYLPLSIGEQRRPIHDTACELHNGPTDFFTEQLQDARLE